MAIGDAAGAAGLRVYSDALLVKDVDDGLNQRGDDVAAVMGRVDKVEGAVSQPIFAVSRSSAPATLPHAVWYIATASLATNPNLIDGFVWSNADGTLKVSKAGIYRLSGSLFFADSPIDSGIEITANSDQVGTSATVVGRLSPGRGVEASRLVRLAANDVLRMLIFQRSADQGARTIGALPYNLTFTAEWVRA